MWRSDGPWPGERALDILGMDRRRMTDIVPQGRTDNRQGIYPLHLFKKRLRVPEGTAENTAHGTDLRVLKKHQIQQDERYVWA